MSAAVPVRAITRGPKCHWFAYYDKLQFDPTGRFVLGMEVDFQHRSPTADDQIAVGVIDLEDGDRWTELGRTKAWCWQQGCMLQWLPGSTDEVIWNDREDGTFVSQVTNIQTGAQRTLPAAVYALSPDGRTAIGADFRRINHMRPGYGYAGLPDPNVDVKAPEDAGIYTVDLVTGEVKVILSIAQVSKLPHPREDLSPSRHYFNHLLVNPNGTRFIFLHRWYRPDGGTFQTRMLTSDFNGHNLHVVDDYNGMSHFIWRDPNHILGWAKRPSHNEAFYLYRDQSDEVEPVGLGVMTRNGHCTYLPNTAWILNDTYPQGAEREQEVYLYHVETDRRIDLGRFATFPEYKGEWRCDTHPRFSHDGRRVTIDSPHGGDGRQIYLLDVGGIVG